MYTVPVPRFLRTDLPPLVVQHNDKELHLKHRRYRLLGFSTDPSYRECQAQSLSDGILHLISYTLQERADVVFFTDRSGRPAAHLFRKVWRQIVPDQPIPLIRHINVGREQKDLDNRFRDRIGPVLARRYGSLAGKSILVADDYQRSGGTGYRTCWMLREAFPDAQDMHLTGVFDESPPWWNRNHGGMVRLAAVKEPEVVADASKAYLVEAARARSVEELRLRRRFRFELDRLAYMIARHARWVASNPCDPITPYFASDTELYGFMLLDEVQAEKARRRR